MFSPLLSKCTELNKLVRFASCKFIPTSTAIKLSNNFENWHFTPTSYWQINFSTYIYPTYKIDIKGSACLNKHLLCSNNQRKKKRPTSFMFMSKN